MASKKKGATVPGEKASDEKTNGGNDGAAELLKKISPSTVLGDKVAKFAPKKGESPVDLFSVYGIASGIKTGETQYGEWEAMTGMFEAVRTSGERFQSGICFMPGAAGEILIGGLKAAKEANPEATVHFAIMVGVKYLERKDGTDGYEFTSKQIVKVQEADVLSDLRAKAIEYQSE